MPQDDKNKTELINKINKLLKTKYNDTSMASQKKLFNAYDKNIDGKINKAELSKLLEDADIGNGFTRKLWVNGVMEEMDSNNDDQISWPEYEKVIKEAGK